MCNFKNITSFKNITGKNVSFFVCNIMHNNKNMGHFSIFMKG